MRTALAATLLAGTLLGTMPGTAFAQAAEGAEVADGVGSDIIVTARRREESLADVPISIAAINGEDLVKRSITNENDLQSAVPGLVIRQNGGIHSFNYSIRGQSVDTFTNSPPSVLPYINEVQIVTHNASTFYDMGGIQVLKGPQGTLFGRNATGGAVLYSTARVTDDTEGYVQARYGRFKSFNLQGAVNMPMTEGVGLRIAFSRTSGGAFVKDYFTNDEYGNLKQTSVRATLRLEPAPGFTNTTTLQYTRERGTNTPYQLWSVNPSPCPSSTAYCLLNAQFNPALPGILAATPAVFQGGLNAAVALQRSLGPWKSLASYPPYHKARAKFGINTTEIELSDSITIKNVFGYNRAKSDDGFDYDGSPYHFFETQGAATPNRVKVVPTEGFRLDTRQISNELQLQGQAIDDRLDYVVGVYYLDQRDRVSSNLLFGEPVFTFPFTYTAQWSTKSIAGFAQATIKATDRLSLTGGIRYTRDKTQIFQLPGSFWLQFVPSNPVEKTKASKPSWTVSADYKITPELMIYAAHRGSWRAGGYNYSVIPLNVTAAEGGNLFLPETTQDIEVGLKYSGDTLGLPVTFNIDVYNQWVKNIQRSAYILTPAGVSLLTVNVPRARIRGLEFDTSVKPSEFISFGASANFTSAKYTNGRVDVLGSSFNYGPFADVPKFSGTLYAEAGFPVGDEARITLRGDLYHQSRMNFSNVSGTVNPNTTLPSYTLLNGRLSVSDLGYEGLTLSAYARNITNEKYWLGGNAASNGGNTNVVNPGMPRAYGLEARIDF